LAIHLKTMWCLKEPRFRVRRLKRTLGNFSNTFFTLMAVALMVTVVHEVYQLPVSVPLKTKIAIGELISDNEVPLIAEAKAMREAALKKADNLMVNKEIKKYARRFRINVELAKLIYNISLDEGVDPDLIFKIIWTESRFKTDCIGKVGEIGLMQVRYNTALSIDPGATRKKLFDPAYNIRIGIKHLKDHLHFYRGDKKLALLAYNRGRGRVNELLFLGINPANGYAKKVLKSRM